MNANQKIASSWLILSILVIVLLVISRKSIVIMKVPALYWFPFTGAFLIGVFSLLTMKQKNTGRVSLEFGLAVVAFFTFASIVCTLGLNLVLLANSLVFLHASASVYWLMTHDFK